MIPKQRVTEWKNNAAKCDQRKIEDEPKAKESSLSVSRADKDGVCVEEG